MGKRIAVYAILGVLTLLSAACSTGKDAVVGPPLPIDRRQVLERVTLAGAALCDCYWKSDCPATGRWVCNYSTGCQLIGKLDGTCQVWHPWKGPISDDPVPFDFFADAGSGNEDEVIRAVDLWFQAYLAAASRGGDGLPDRALIDRALAARLPDRAHVGIKDTVFNVLDVLAGFDFAMPRGNCFAHDPRCLGFFRIPLDAEGVRLLETGRRGFIEALRARDRRPAERALAEFWARSPYEPHHTGRCYPHGHAEFAAAGGSPVVCQQRELGGMLDLIFDWLPGRGAPSN